MAGELLIDLGAGYRPYHDGRDWIHLDINPGPDIEIVCDARDILDHVAPGSVDELRCTHLLEHFSHRDTVDVLTVWRKALRHGGSLYIEVPNIFGHIAAFQRGEITEEQFIVYVYGEQDFPGNAHYAGFSPEILRQRLVEAGYHDIKTQDIGLVLIASGRRP